MARSIEKRRHTRLKTERFFVEYMMKGFDAVYRAEVINISAGGLCFVRDAVVRRGDFLTLKFPFKSKKIIFSGEVLRVDGREVGVSFHESEENIERLVEIFNHEYPSYQRAGTKKIEKLYVRESDRKADNNDNGFLDIEP
jgi:hypothetical protein